MCCSVLLCSSNFSLFCSPLFYNEHTTLFTKRERDRERERQRETDEDEDDDDVMTKKTKKKKRENV